MPPVTNGHLIADHSLAAAASVCELLTFPSDNEFAEALSKIAKRIEAVLIHYEQQRVRQSHRLSPLDTPASKN